MHVINFKYDTEFRISSASLGKPLPEKASLELEPADIPMLKLLGVPTSVAEDGAISATVSNFGFAVAPESGAEVLEHLALWHLQRAMEGPFFSDDAKARFASLANAARARFPSEVLALEAAYGEAEVKQLCQRRREKDAAAEAERKNSASADEAEAKLVAYEAGGERPLPPSQFQWPGQYYWPDYRGSALQERLSAEDKKRKAIAEAREAIRGHARLRLIASLYKAVAFNDPRLEVCSPEHPLGAVPEGEAVERLRDTYLPTGSWGEYEKIQERDMPPCERRDHERYEWRRPSFSTQDIDITDVTTQEEFTATKRTLNGLNAMMETITSNLSSQARGEGAYEASFTTQLRYHEACCGCEDSQCLVGPHRRGVLVKLVITSATCPSGLELRREYAVNVEP